MIINILLLVTSHITLNPNFGAESGGYFHTTIRVPHATENSHTTRLDITIPHGILVAKPEIPEDWTAKIETRTLLENEQYVSHGVLKTEAPSKITLQANTHADGVHDDYLLNVDIQLKIGCIFQNENFNTIWNNEYTLWWKIDQYCESANGDTFVYNWNGTQHDAGDGSSPSWSALPNGMHPAPYLYVEPGTRCSIENSGDELNGGLMWFGIHELGDSNSILISTPNLNPKNTDTLIYITLVVSIVSIVLTTIVTSLLSAMCCMRFRNKKKFTERLIGVEYCACKELASVPHNTFIEDATSRT